MSQAKTGRAGWGGRGGRPLCHDGEGMVVWAWLHRRTNRQWCCQKVLARLNPPIPQGWRRPSPCACLPSHHSTPSLPDTHLQKGTALRRLWFHLEHARFGHEAFGFYAFGFVGACCESVARVAFTTLLPGPRRRPIAVACMGRKLLGGPRCIALISAAAATGALVSTITPWSGGRNRRQLFFLCRVSSALRPFSSLPTLSG